jgi:hypothetical protein
MSCFGVGLERCGYSVGDSSSRAPGEDSKPMRRLAQVNGSKPSVRGPAVPSGVLLLTGITLVELPSGGFEYRKRDAGRAVVARPTGEFCAADLGHAALTDMGFPGSSGGSSPSSNFRAWRSASALRPLFWGLSLWDVAGMAHYRWDSGSAPPLTHPGPRLARQLHNPHECRRVRFARFGDPT